MFFKGVISMKLVHTVAYVFLLAGGLNWGLVGLFNLNLVNTLLGSLASVERLVYILVGVATIYVAATHQSK